MSIEVVISVILIFLGLVLSMTNFRSRVPTVLNSNPSDETKRTSLFFRSFVIVVVIFGLVTVVYHWAIIVQNTTELLFSFWLGITMICGMIVQVITTNYKKTQRFLTITVDQLVYPLLFSFVVFYPIWAIAASAPKNFFVFHAAFLNGYFWESIVSSSRPPEIPLNSIGSQQEKVIENEE